MTTTRQTPQFAVNRRRLIGAGAAGICAQAVSGLSSPASGALPLVRPISSDSAFRSFGVCAHPNHLKSVYQYSTQWVDALANINAHFIRGMYDHRLSATPIVTRRLRERGMRWGMTVCPDLKTPDSLLAARIEHIAKNAADLCLYIEGVNEPNHDRSGGSVPKNWAQLAVAKQKVIWEAVRKHNALNHVKVMGPSLRAVSATAQDHINLRNNRLLDYSDCVGIHSYPGGRYPSNSMDSRCSLAKTYWPGTPIWITEIGYTNALATNSGHRPASESVSAIYAPIALLECLDRGYPAVWYEALDDPDAGAKDNIESNFGLYALNAGMAPPWRMKPAAAALRDFLATLRDPGAAYTPKPIPLQVQPDTPDVRATAIARRDGSVRLLLRRSTDCWDPQRGREINVSTVNVRVTTGAGTRSVTVGSQIRSIAL